MCFMLLCSCHKLVSGSKKVLWNVSVCGAFRFTQNFQICGSVFFFMEGSVWQQHQYVVIQNCDALHVHSPVHKPAKCCLFMPQLQPTPTTEMPVFFATKMISKHAAPQSTNNMRKTRFFMTITNIVCVVGGHKAIKHSLCCQHQKSCEPWLLCCELIWLRFFPQAFFCALLADNMHEWSHSLFIHKQMLWYFMLWHPIANNSCKITIRTSYCFSFAKHCRFFMLKHWRHTMSAELCWLAFCEQRPHPHWNDAKQPQSTTIAATTADNSFCFKFMAIHTAFRTVKWLQSSEQWKAHNRSVSCSIHHAGTGTGAEESTNTPSQSNQLCQKQRAAMQWP